MANETTNIIQRLMNQDVLISEADVKVLTPASANKAKGTLIKHIVTSQDMHIKKAIGSTMYAQLLAEYKANNLNGSILPDGTTAGTTPIIADDKTNYLLLYENIVKPLAWWSYVLSLATTAFNPTEQGILKRGTDESDAVTLDEFKKVEADGKATARAYMAELKEYVEEAFRNDKNVEDEKVEETNAANMGFFVPKKRWHGKSNY